MYLKKKEAWNQNYFNWKNKKLLLAICLNTNTYVFACARVRVCVYVLVLLIRQWRDFRECAWFHIYFSSRLYINTSLICYIFPILYRIWCVIFILLPIRWCGLFLQWNLMIRGTKIVQSKIHTALRFLDLFIWFWFDENFFLLLFPSFTTWFFVRCFN